MPLLPPQELLLGRRSEEHARLDICLAHLIALVGEKALHVWSHTAAQRPFDRPRSEAPQPFPRLARPVHHGEPADQPPSYEEREAALKSLPVAFRLLENPTLITVVCTASGIPQHLYLHNARYTVTAADGPYLTQGGWWEQPWSERTFRVRLESSSSLVGWLQIAQVERESTHWLLQGAYD